MNKNEIDKAVYLLKGIGIFNLHNNLLYILRKKGFVKYYNPESKKYYNSKHQCIGCDEDIDKEHTVKAILEEVKWESFMNFCIKYLTDDKINENKSDVDKFLGKYVIVKLTNGFYDCGYLSKDTSFLQLYNLKLYKDKKLFPVPYPRYLVETPLKNGSLFSNIYIKDMWMIILDDYEKEVKK